MRLRGACTAFLLSMTAVVYAGNLTPLESSIAENVVDQKQNQLKFLEEITNIDSGTLNTKGVHAVGEVVRKELSKLGFKSRWADEPAVMHRAGTLVEVHEGKSKQKLLLIGHLDTVFSNETSKHLYTQKQHSAKGPGIIDDKGGVAVLLYALKALQTEGELKNLSIMIVLTGDEEDSGKPASISRQPLILAASKCNIALDFEPAITLNTATIARRGITNWTLTVHGNASHSATIFQDNVGMGAIFGIATQLNEMRLQLQHTKNLSFNPGMIFGGSSVQFNPVTGSGSASGKENIVAAIAMAKGDVRYVDETQKQFAKEKMRGIISAKLSGVRSEIEFIDGIPPMSPTKNNMKLLEQYSLVSQDLDQGRVVALAPGVRGAGDISYVANIVPASLSGLGPVGNGTHTVIESAELASFVIQTQRAAILIKRLANADVI